jgi:hypothetical protein
MALQLMYLMFSKLLSWIVLRTRSDTTKEAPATVEPREQTGLRPEA